MKKRITALFLSFVILVFSFGAGALLLGYYTYRRAVGQMSLEQKVEIIKASEYYVPLEQIPEMYKNAVIATEDRRFYEHGALDFRSLARSAVTDFKSFSLEQGGSTITQQLAKNFYFTGDKFFVRKIAEVFAAYAIERKYSKDEILTLYANTIYFGKSSNGIGQAARNYYGRRPRELSDFMCVTLAGLPKAPSYYERNPDMLKIRQRQVIGDLMECGFITPSQAGSMLAQIG
ncbi:MAG: transglycosylase domain-containing protein [Clostridia bacterium]|nr:transglycosylase domain-containing protein [Clostridia bacterium]